MDIERYVISKAMESRDFKPLLDHKITTDFFDDDEHRLVFKWCIEYWREYSEVPTPKALKANFPGYTLYKTDEPYQYYIDQLRERRKYGLLHETVTDVADALEEKDTGEAVNRLARGLTKVNTEVTTVRDVNVVTTWKDRLARYDEYASNPGLRGIPTGFHTVDIATGGLQPEQLVGIVGLPKGGKSTLAMVVAKAVQDYGKRAMFISFEMSNEEQESRYDALCAGIPHKALISGKLTTTQREKLETSMKLRQNMPDFIISGDITGATTVSGIASKIEQNAPAALFIDGVYLMDDEEGQDKGSPQALTNLTRGLKRVAQKARIPIVYSTQVLPSKMRRRDGITPDSIGYSSSFIQDSDVIFGMEDVKGQHDVKKLRVVLSRNCPPMDTLVLWDWDSMRFEEQDTDWDEEDDADNSTTQVY